MILKTVILKAIRNGDWKLVFPHKSQTCKKKVMGSDGFPVPYASDSVKRAFYNLRTDPGETMDIHEKYPNKVRWLNMLADRYRKDLGDDLTGNNGTGKRQAARIE